MPVRCKITYTCVSIDRVDNDFSKDKITCADDFTFDGIYDSIGTDGLGSFTAPITKYTDQTYPPGDYIITIRGTTVKADTPLTDTTTFVLRLIDPCDPPTSITAPNPGFQDQDYILYDVPAKTYTHPDFVIVPAACPFITTYSYTTLSDG